MGEHAQLRKKGMVVTPAKRDHVKIFNPINNRSYSINPLKKTKYAVPDQLIALKKTLDLCDDFCGDLT